jgi:hypothetical protein
MWHIVTSCDTLTCLWHTTVVGSLLWHIWWPMTHDNDIWYKCDICYKCDTHDQCQIGLPKPSATASLSGRRQKWKSQVAVLVGLEPSSSSRQKCYSDETNYVLLYPIYTIYTIYNCIDVYIYFTCVDSEYGALRAKFVNSSGPGGGLELELELLLPYPTWSICSSDGLVFG